MYFGWNLSLSNLSVNLPTGLYVLFITASIIQCFLPGLFFALIVFPIFRKKTNSEKVHISLLLLFCFLFILGSLYMFGMEKPDVLFFTLALGFISIKLVERNIEKLHAKEI